MRYRTFGRTGWKVSDIGYGMWGVGEWKGTEEQEAEAALDRAVELGANFFDTAWAYGDGKSEQILAKLLKRQPGKKLYVATKIPPKDRNWPPVKGTPVSEVYPSDYIIEYTEKSLKNIGVEQIDLQQFHVWEDDWAAADEWKNALEKLKQQGKIAAAGVSINRWEPENALKTLQTGLIDSVQVIYNIFDQAPEDKLFPYCQEKNIAVIARVPFDEGTLTGKLTKKSTWPEGDWRNTYFVPENLNSSVEHAEALKPLAEEQGLPMPELALRFILTHPAVSTTIPGMRTLSHVEANIGCSDLGGLKEELIQELRKHRWDRQPTEWSQ